MIHSEYEVQSTQEEPGIPTQHKASEKSESNFIFCERSYEKFLIQSTKPVDVFFCAIASVFLILLGLAFVLPYLTIAVFLIVAYSLYTVALLCFIPYVLSFTKWNPLSMSNVIEVVICGTHIVNLGWLYCIFCPMHLSAAKL
jgi:hypothetical protein